MYPPQGSRKYTQHKWLHASFHLLKNQLLFINRQLNSYDFLNNTLNTYTIYYYQNSYLSY